jgi:hypothetical protein
VKAEVLYLDFTLVSSPESSQTNPGSAGGSSNSIICLTSRRVLDAALWSDQTVRLNQAKGYPEELAHVGK